MTLKLKDIDNGFAAMGRALAHKPGKVNIGISESADREVVLRALAHEFGSEDGRIKQRAPVRSTMDTNKEKYRKVLKGIGLEALGKMLHGEKPNVKGSLDQLGRMGVRDVKAAIKSDKFGQPPLQLAASTLARKRALGQPDTALIATHEMLDSYMYAVEGEE